MNKKHAIHRSGVNVQVKHLSAARLAGTAGGKHIREQGPKKEKGCANAYPSAGCERPLLIQALFNEVRRGEDFKDKRFATKSHDYCPENNNFEVLAKSHLILKHQKKE